MVQDVAGVTQASLRESMGVVPQDTVCACPLCLPLPAAWLRVCAVLTANSPCAIPFHSSTAGTCLSTPCSWLWYGHADHPVLQVLFNDTIMYNIR